MVVAILSFCAAMFALMGVLSLVRPLDVVRQFGVRELTADGRNEMFAVYGGFGLATAGVLFAAIFVPSVRPGVLLAVAFALGGMALGRLLSFAAERRIGRFPRLYLALELIGAALLAYAFAADYARHAA